MILSSKKQLSEIRAKNKDKKIVMVNGVFDLLHIGHVNLLESSKKLGDILVVMITNDSSINKDPSRPIVGQPDRSKMIDSLSFVDYVFINSSKRSRNISDWPGYHLRPNIFISNPDSMWLKDERLKHLGIEVKSLPRTKGISTTSIIDKIRANG
jgi:rfaE bifunctional protein nucleotidyltransferase chain/domain